MRWPPYEHIIFDCDSTLTAIEGIDVLAEEAGKKWRVEVLTRAAMEGVLDLEEVYARRLAAVNPTRGQVRAISHAYRRWVVEDAAAVMKACQSLGQQVYIISGGLYEAVVEFGLHLGVPRSHIRAVALAYNQLHGSWWEGNPWSERYLAFDDSPLTVSDGKAAIVRELLAGRPGRSLLIGDGSSDLQASEAVDLFVGYGGVEKRDPVLRQAPVYIHSRSLAPLLTIACGPAWLNQLRTTSLAALADKALHLTRQGAVTFKDERLNQKFQQAYQAFYSGAG